MYRTAGVAAVSGTTSCAFQTLSNSVLAAMAQLLEMLEAYPIRRAYQALADSSQGMRARSWAPTFSIEWPRSAFSSLEYLRRPLLVSAIHWRANLPC